jgi:hypothetical protein
MNEAQSATLSADQRKKVLDRVLAALQKRFYAPEKLNGDWQAAVERHRPLIESANTSADFEKEVSDLLKELQTSHLGFFHRSARRASSHAALSATYLEMRRSLASDGFFKMYTPVEQRLRLASSQAIFFCVSMIGTSFRQSIQFS